MSTSGAPLCEACADAHRLYHMPSQRLQTALRLPYAGRGHHCGGRCATCTPLAAALFRLCAPDTAHGAAALAPYSAAATTATATATAAAASAPRAPLLLRSTVVAGSGHGMRTAAHSRSSFCLAHVSPRCAWLM